MKATGVVRKIDELGRLVVPMEIRREFGLLGIEKVDIYLDAKFPECIVVEKFDEEASAIGVARNLDNLGRFVVPMEMRRNFCIGDRCALEFFTENNKIYIKKYNPGCIFCDDINNTVEYKGRKVCKNCIAKLNENK